MISIRRAEQQDCKTIFDLVKELAEYEKAPNEVTVSFEAFSKSGFGENPVWWGIVAVDDTNNEIVGFALYYIRFSTWKGESLYLEDLLVTEAMRGKGIGTMLFDAIIDECNTKGYHRLCWQVLEWNEPAIKFYKKYQASLDGEWINGALEIPTGKN